MDGGSTASTSALTLVRVTVTVVLEQRGGICRREDLLAVVSDAEVRRALRAGEVVRRGRGRYALPVVDEAVGVAHGLGGVLSHSSAALWWGWEVRTVPLRPHVTVPRGRRLTPAQRATAVVHHGRLLREEVVEDRCTSQEVTLEQCVRSLPEDDGLAVVDSALRHDLDPAVVRRLALSVRGPGAGKVRRVLARGDGRAANPFESVLRHHALQVPGLRVVPQRVVALPGGDVRPDLVDEDLRVVLEADSFAWHGDRAALRRDARRYNALVTDGWLVLRFAWEDVMHEPAYVAGVLTAVTRIRTQVAV